MRGHCYDALVGVAGCDKSLPGMMMAMLRLNVPSVFMYGGSILPGKFKGRDVTVVDVFEGVGMHSAGKMSDDGAARARVRRLSRRRLLRRPVHRQHDGLRLRSDRPGAARFGRRARALREPRRLCARKRQGRDAPASPTASVRATSARARPSRTRPSSLPRPAARPTAALHLPAMANEVGIEFDLFDVCRDLQAHALHRRPEARRQIRRQGRLRHRRRAADPEGAARRRRTCTATA